MMEGLEGVEEEVREILTFNYHHNTFAMMRSIGNHATTASHEGCSMITSLTVIAQGLSRIMVPLWYNGCGIGNLAIKVDQRWSSRDRV